MLSRVCSVNSMVVGVNSLCGSCSKSTQEAKEKLVRSMNIFFHCILVFRMKHLSQVDILFDWDKFPYQVRGVEGYLLTIQDRFRNI